MRKDRRTGGQNDRGSTFALLRLLSEPKNGTEIWLSQSQSSSLGVFVIAK